MKMITLIIAGVLFTILTLAQPPQSFKYQAVLRDGSGNVRANQTVSITIAIVQGSTSSIAIYSETHNISTNEFGLINIEVGNGVTADNFSEIDWSKSPYFIRLTVDGTEFGTSQLLSVPYALHAGTAESIIGGISETDPVFGSSVASGISGDDIANWNNKSETDPVFGSSVASSISGDDIANWNNKLNSYAETQSLADVISINDSANAQIKNLTDPTDLQDATTKAYVDQMIKDMQKLVFTQIAGGSLTDIDGNVYNTVKIGNQVWMAENLKTSRLNDGTIIPLVTENETWSNLETYGYCWYNNDSVTNSHLYGALYNWYTVNTTTLCPTNWHVPSDEEWNALIDFIGVDGAGDKLRQAGTTHWNSPNARATNESGFSGLPGGYRASNGLFGNINKLGSFWSTLNMDANYAYMRYLSYNFPDLYKLDILKKSGHSVRCVKD